MRPFELSTPNWSFVRHSLSAVVGRGRGVPVQREGFRDIRGASVRLGAGAGQVGLLVEVGPGLEIDVLVLVGLVAGA